MAMAIITDARGREYFLNSEDLASLFNAIKQRYQSLKEKIGGLERLDSAEISKAIQSGALPSVLDTVNFGVALDSLKDLWTWQTQEDAGVLDRILDQAKLVAD